MSQKDKSFKRFFVESDAKEESYISIEVEKSLHSFYEGAAPFYDTSVNTIINNILRDWISVHHPEIKKDILSKIGNVRFK